MNAEQPDAGSSEARPLPGLEVVIIGAGFAGLEVAKGFGKAGSPQRSIDRHNHHLFQPLLYQVATAALSATDVAEPIRKVLRRHKSVQVLFGRDRSDAPLPRDRLQPAPAPRPSTNASRKPLGSARSGPGSQVGGRELAAEERVGAEPAPPGGWCAPRPA